MPTYEYVCTECDNHWEEVQKISEPAVETCPKCAKSAAKRQISGGTFILKGGGWYADLYSSTPKGGGPKSDGAGGGDASSAGGPAKTETKAETKPETKGDTKSTQRETKSETKPPSAAPPPSTSSK